MKHLLRHLQQDLQRRNFADVGDDTRKIQFDLSNIEDNQTYVFSFPDDDPSAPLNNGTASNMLVAERKTQTLYNKR